MRQATKDATTDRVIHFSGTDSELSKQLKSLFFDCVHQAFVDRDKVDPEALSGPDLADRLSRGLSVEDKTLLLMKFISDRNVLQLLYQTMMEM